MKKIIALITVVFLISSMFGAVYAEDNVEQTVSNEIQQVLADPEQGVTDVVEETEDTQRDILQ